MTGNEAMPGVRVLHVLPTSDPAFGGPVSTTVDLADASNEIGLVSAIWPPEYGLTFGRNLAYLPGPYRLRHLARAIRLHDIVMLHGLWTVPVTIAAFLSRRAGRPYIVSPHGMLDAWSLKRRRWKKQLYLRALQRRDLECAAAMRFTNDEEMREAGPFGLQIPRFVLPNGVARNRVSWARPEHARPAQRDPRASTMAVFLGRIHPKKGLSVLIPALAEARQSMPQLHLVVAGPDEGGYRRRVEAMVADSGQQDSVTFTGMLLGDAKWELLKKADFFVLPSFQEGDPSAVKEAMAMGLPVLVTPACHMSDVLSEGAGLIVEPTVGQLAAGLRTLAADPDGRLEMGARARRIIQEHFGVDQIASVFREVCVDVLSGEFRASAWRGR